MGELFQPWHVMVLFFVGMFFLIPAIFYVLTLQKTLSQCSPASRTMEPGLVWLYLIPFVNLVFHFFIVFAISKSVANEFARRGAQIDDPQPCQVVGLAMCICGCCGLIPFLGLVAWLAHLVLWIIYWVKVAEYSGKLDILPAPAEARFNMG